MMGRPSLILKPLAGSDLAPETTHPLVVESPLADWRWVGIAANAASGRGKGRVLVDRLADELGRLGWETQVAWSPAERRGLVAAAAEGDAGCRCLVAVGGDGTVAALINECPSVPIAVVPAGTENLFARHFGFEPKPQAGRRPDRRGAGGVDGPGPGRRPPVRPDGWFWV